jgi:hypothetical protein
MATPHHGAPCRYDAPTSAALRRMLERAVVAGEGDPADEDGEQVRCVRCVTFGGLL